MTADPLIDIAGLGAMRGERILFKDQFATVHAGQICLLRGTNGSGKTTFLRLVAGLIPIEAGKLNVNGACHWVGHADGLKPHETPRQHLNHWARAWGSPADIDRILAQNGLERAADVSATSLSAGQRRRSAFGRLQLVERPVWLLDEPFSALDAEGRTLIADQVSAHCANGGTVVAAVHGNSPLRADLELTL
ncbi:MAG: heme ABC exporter ATP-binding protein CcmA [Pseudomonadota bacterium]